MTPWLQQYVINSFLIIEFVFLFILGISQVSDCPCCRAKTKVDSKTQYVLCSQVAMMSGFPDGRAVIGLKMLWRLFCVPCCTRISGSIEMHQGSPDGEILLVPTIDLVKDGRGAPFVPIRNYSTFSPVPLYKRTSSMTKSGLHATISHDYTKYCSNMLGGKASIKKTENVGESQKSMFAMNNKIFEKCSGIGCNNGAHKVAMNLGFERTKPLMLCG